MNTTPAPTTSTPVRFRPPPARLMRTLNPLMKVLIRSRLGRRMRPLAVVRFTGRRSGKTRALPLGVHDVGDFLAVFTSSSWRHNFQEPTHVAVSWGGHTSEGTAQLVEDQSRVAPALAVAFNQVGARKLGLAVDDGRQPTIAELAAVGRSMIEIHLDT